MAITADRVVVELEAKLGRYEANLARAEQKFDRAMGGIQKSATRTEGLISRAAGRMGAALGAVSVALLAREFLNLTDKAKSLEAQLRLATKESGSFGKAQEDVRRIAASTRSGLEATALLYGNFQRNARELGITQQEAARATETVAKTFKISGAGAVEAAQGTRQLVQALQSGVLRGDEFNTIMESSPRLARLLADSLGIAVGELRAMAEAGNLTSAQLVRAFTDTKFTEGLDQEFKQLPVTFGEAMQQIENAAIITFGAFDRGGEFSKILSNFVLDGTKGFADLEKSAEQFGANTRAEIEGISAVFGPLLSNMSQMLGLMEQSSNQPMFSTLFGELDALSKWASNNQLLFRLATMDFSGLRDPRPTNLQGTYLAGRAGFLNQRDQTFAGGFAGRFLDQFPDAFGRPTPVPRPAAGSKASGRKRATGGGRARAAKAEEDPLADFREETLSDLAVISHTWVTEMREARDQELEEEVARLRTLANVERELKKEVADELAQRQEQQVQTLAGLYESAFRGGTKAIWRDFKQIGLSVIAEVLARFTISRLNGSGGSLGSFFGQALASVLPGFAGGGSFAIGGRGGIDRNTLSLNGRPIANVSRGERVHVSNEALRGGGGGATVVQHINVDMRNSVTPDGFARELLAISNQQALRAAGGMGQAILKGMPTRLTQFQRDGT